MTHLILAGKQLDITIERLCHQLIENHGNFKDTCIIGLQSKGVPLSKRICKRLSEFLPESTIQHGALDITFFRDDYRRSEKLLMPSRTEIDFIVEGKNVVMVDDE